MRNPRIICTQYIGSIVWSIYPMISILLYYQTNIKRIHCSPTAYPLWQQQLETFLVFFELHLSTFLGPDSLLPIANIYHLVSLIFNCLYSADFTGSCHTLSALTCLMYILKLVTAQIASGYLMGFPFTFIAMQ